MIGKRKDNVLLVEFEFVVDLDLAMYRYMKDRYYQSDMVDKKFLSIKDEREIIFKLLSRPHISPLELIIPDYDSSSIYYDLIDNEENYKDLLSYATAYDTFALMITFLKEASSVDITILCKSKLEEEFIHKLNPILRTVVIPEKQNVPIGLYTAIYMKYFINTLLYKNLKGKHIYIPAAKFNMEENKDMPQGAYVKLFGDTNEIHLIDLYRFVKYRYSKKGNDNKNE